MTSFLIHFCRFFIAILAERFFPDMSFDCVRESMNQNTNEKKSMKYQRLIDFLPFVSISIGCTHSCWLLDLLSR